MNIAWIALSFLLGVLLFQTSGQIPSHYTLLILPLCIFIGIKFPKTRFLLFPVLGYCWAMLFSLIVIYPALSPVLEDEEIRVQG